MDTHPMVRICPSLVRRFRLKHTRVFIGI